MLGIDVSESTVTKYMIRHRGPPSQSWRTILDNHAAEFASIDFFTVPTATFRVLYVFIILKHDQREVVHFNITRIPTAQWIAQQIVEAFPFDPPPRYLLRDRDCIYGERFRRRVKSLGIEEIITAPRSPWQNPYVEQLVGTLNIAIDLCPKRDILNVYPFGLDEYQWKKLVYLNLTKVRRSAYPSRWLCQTQ